MMTKRSKKLTDQNKLCYKFSSINIVKPSTVSLKCLTLNIEETNSSSEFFNIDLDKFNNFGLTVRVNTSCRNMTNKDTRTKRFTM